MSPKRAREYANRRRHVKYDQWPGDLYHIPLCDCYYRVGIDGESLTHADPFPGNAAENVRRQNLARMPP